MLIYKFFQRTAAVTLAVIGLASLAGCKTDFTTVPPVGTGNEKTLFQSYVALGTSLDAGYQSGSLFNSGQQHSFPVLLAQQAGVTNFQVPLVDQNGIGNRLVFMGLSNGNPIIVVNPTIGSPLNALLPRAYNNLGVPGAIAADFFDSSAVNSATRRNNPYFGLVLRNQAFGKSLAAQMASLNPSLVSVWYGPNEVLGYATSGGLQAPLYAANSSIGYPGFAAVYTNVIQTIKATAPNAKIVVATVPDVTSIPFATTVGPLLKAKLQKFGIQQIYYQATVGSSIFVPTAGAVSDIGNKTKFLYLLTGQSALSLIGDTTGATIQVPAILNNGTVVTAPYSIGKYWRDFWTSNGQGLPAPFNTSFAVFYTNFASLSGGTPLDTTKAFGLDPRNPIPNQYVLDANEIAIATATLNGINTVIKSQGVPVVDVNGIFNTIATTGIVSDGTTFNANFLSGNTFSLDGVHPSSKADGILANSFIDVINTNFGTNIPKVNTLTLTNGITLP
jgi:hypothetical protein